MIGRIFEKQYLQELAEGDETQLVAVNGRHRIGKTYHARQTLEKQMLFDHTGIKSQATVMPQGIRSIG